MSRPLQDIILEYFYAHPKQELQHGPVVDWATSEWLKEHSTPPRDPWRAIRSLAQSGNLIKIDKGIYMYDPDFIQNRELEDFTPEQKAIILSRDQYKCVICGLGRDDGMELHVDHIKPKELGGKATIENGQTLCATHNFRKKTYSQTESGKRMFIRLYEYAKAIDDQATIEFCEDILQVYDRHNMNGHIEWTD
jgi:5-methylcytosine-specific restriction endonuclease McrA